MGQAAGRGSAATLTRPQIAADMASALDSAATSAAGAELLRRYVPQLLDADSSVVLSLFVRGDGHGESTAASKILGADEVLKLLQGHNKLLLGYLEDRVLKQRDASQTHAMQLGSIYLQQVAAEVKKNGAGGAQREKALHFLEESDTLNARDLLPRARELELSEEQVVLCFRQHEHLQALQILVETLDDLPRAEIYCRIVMARGAVVTGSAERSLRVPIFCSPPPFWASPAVFRPRRGSSAAGDEESSEVKQQQQSSSDQASVPDGAAALLGPAIAATPSIVAQEEQSNNLAVTALRNVAMGLAAKGARPLLFFLQVLLAAYTGAQQNPQKYPKVAAEYRDATLSLLTGYAGHHDLPPHEVIGLLPDDWSLDSLAEYLTKSTRLCLHERRANMLEENLSSMAYLKTFDALTQERMRKVTITGDRCCPVCNRRFVDKDSVGKAFVAYPNETCVHLQCKEDLSVCPKTGQSFADNVNVFCNALAVEPSE